SLEIARDAAAKVLCLADVNDLAARIEHPVDARPMRQVAQQCGRVEGAGGDGRDVADLGGRVGRLIGRLGRLIGGVRRLIGRVGRLTGGVWRLTRRVRDVVAGGARDGRARAEIVGGRRVVAVVAGRRAVAVVAG